MSPIQCPRNLSEASLATSSSEVRKTSRSVGIAVKRHFGTAGHWATVIVWTERPTLMKCSSARFRGWSGHVQASVKESNVASRAINRGDFVAGLIVEFLEGDLADDLVAEIAPGPGGRGCHDQGHRKCEADEGTEQLRMAHKESLLQMNAVLPKPRLKSQSPSAVNWTSIFTVRPL